MAFEKAFSLYQDAQKGWRVETLSKSTICPYEKNTPQPENSLHPPPQTVYLARDEEPPPELLTALFSMAGDIVSKSAVYVHCPGAVEPLMWDRDRRLFIFTDRRF